MDQALPEQTQGARVARPQPGDPGVVEAPPHPVRHRAQQGGAPRDEHVVIETADIAQRLDIGFRPVRFPHEDPVGGRHPVRGQPVRDPASVHLAERYARPGCGCRRGGREPGAHPGIRHQPENVLHRASEYARHPQAEAGGRHLGAGFNRVDRLSGDAEKPGQRPLRESFGLAVLPDVVFEAGVHGLPPSAGWRQRDAFNVVPGKSVTFTS